MQLAPRVSDFRSCIPGNQYLERKEEPKKEVGGMREKGKGRRKRKERKEGDRGSGEERKGKGRREARKQGRGEENLI